MSGEPNHIWTKKASEPLAELRGTLFRKVKRVGKERIVVDPTARVNKSYAISGE